METVLVNTSDKARSTRETSCQIIQDIYYIAQFQLISDRTIEFPEEATRKIILKRRRNILLLDGKWQEI